MLELEHAFLIEVHAFSELWKLAFALSVVGMLMMAAALAI